MKYTLRQTRLLREISQEKMANELGIHRNTYANWEDNPGRIPIEQAKRISEILQVKTDDIFFN